MKRVSFLLLGYLAFVSCTPLARIPVPTSQAAPTASSTPTSTPTLVPTPTIMPTPTPVGGGSGKFIFEYDKLGFEAVFPELSGTRRVFTSDVDGTHLSLVTDAIKGAYYHIEDISQDGHIALIKASSSLSGEGDLYLVHLDVRSLEPVKLAHGLSSYWSSTNDRHAMFLDDSRVVFIGSGVEGKGIYTVRADGTDPEKIATYNSEDAALHAANDHQVYWAQSEKKSFKDSSGFKYIFGDFHALYWANIDGSAQGKLESGGSQIVPDDRFYWDAYAFSPEGKKLAWIPAQTEAGCRFSYVYPELVDTYARRCYIMYIASLSDLDHPVKVVLMPPPDLVAGGLAFGREYTLMWSPAGDTILLFNDGDAYWSTPGSDHQPVLFQVETTGPDPKLQEVKHGLFKDVAHGTIAPIALSPDGRKLLMVNWASDSDVAFPYINLVDLISGARQASFVKQIAPGADPGHQLEALTIRWLP